MSLVISGEPPSGYLPRHPQLYLRVWQATAAAPGGPGDPARRHRRRHNAHLEHRQVPRRRLLALRVPTDPAAIVYPARYLAAPQPPDGPRTWACPLAVLTWDGGTATASTLRPAFRRASSIRPPPRADAARWTSDRRRRRTGPRCTRSSAAPMRPRDRSPSACEPGTYTLPAPLVLGPEFDGITLQACREGVILQAPSSPAPSSSPGSSRYRA